MNMNIKNYCHFTDLNMNNVLKNIKEVQLYLQHYNEDADNNNLRLNYLINEISDMVTNQLNVNNSFYEKENKTGGN